MTIASTRGRNAEETLRFNALAGNPDPIRCGGKKSKVLNVYYVPKSLNSRESSTRE
jgi:hypothetical protein